MEKITVSLNIYIPYFKVSTITMAESVEMTMQQFKHFCIYTLPTLARLTKTEDMIPFKSGHEYFSSGNSEKDFRDFYSSLKGSSSFSLQSGYGNITLQTPVGATFGEVLFWEHEFLNEELPTEEDWLGLLTSTCILGADYWLEEGFIYKVTNSHIEITSDPEESGVDIFQESFSSTNSGIVTTKTLKKFFTELKLKEESKLCTAERNVLNTFLHGPSSWDAEMADIALQIILFGEVIFG